MSGAMWGAIADAAMQVGSAWMNSDAQRLANRTNVKLQREQQAWEKDMSDTAVQRRVADLTAAGGNPALAFTNGSEATTPTISAAHVEAPKYDVKTNFTGAAVSKAQIQNIQADTMDKMASARSKTVQAQIDEDLARNKREFQANQYTEGVDQADLKTKIMRNLDASSAAEAKRQAETVDSMIQTAKQQAKEGKLKLDALENIAKIGGIEANQMGPIIKLLISTFISLKD